MVFDPSTALRAGKDQTDNGVDSRFKCQRGYSTLRQAQSRLIQPFDPSSALRAGSAQDDNRVIDWVWW